MKKLTILLGLLLALMLGFVGVFWFGGKLSAEPRVLSAGAADYPKVFESIRSVLDAGAAPQTFDANPLGDASAYTMLDITVALTNPGFFPAEWLHVDCAAQPGDIAVYSLTGEGSDVPARGTGQVNLKLLTTSGALKGRTVTLEYYVHGMKRVIVVPPPEGEKS